MYQGKLQNYIRLLGNYCINGTLGELVKLGKKFYY